MSTIKRTANVGFIRGGAESYLTSKVKHSEQMVICCTAVEYRSGNDSGWYRIRIGRITVLPVFISIT